MLKNFFKTAWRNILRYKVYSVINFVGLTCGLTLALLIFAYTRSELSYDQFDEKASRLYRFKYLVSNGLKLAGNSGGRWPMRHSKRRMNRPRTRMPIDLWLSISGLIDSSDT